MNFAPNPYSNGQPSFWKEILLAAIPAFVGACLPPVIAYHLSKKQAEHEAKVNAGAAKTTPKPEEAAPAKRARKKKPEASSEE